MSPKGPTRMPPITGPVTKPASSTPLRVPRRRATSTSLMLITMARDAGENRELERPTTQRATTSMINEEERANKMLPATARVSPPSSNRLEWPRSARGESRTWPMRPTRKPDPAIRPRPASPKPYSSWRLPRRAKTTLFAIPIAAEARRRGYQPAGRTVVTRGVAGGARHAPGPSRVRGAVVPLSARTPRRRR